MSGSVRTVVLVISIGLIVVGLFRLVEVRTPNRPEGSADQIGELADRDDLNIVFMLIDTLRADRLSAYGYERETSPIFDALADSGILFRDVWAQSTWTKCSMASLWTATHPASNGITRYPHGLPDLAEMPAELLREQGFRTVGIWRNGWVAPNFGFDQGFDLYYRPKARSEVQRRVDNPSAFQLAGTDLDLTKAGVEFLRGVGDERFMLYLHYMDVHQYVYDESADFGTSYSDIYDNSIHWVDRNLGTLVAALQEEGLMERTVLVVASDHGEAFDEHGTEGHARNLYRETTGVPLLITLPFRLEEGIVVETPVENTDIWPTVFDLLGLPALPGAQGRSLVPLVEAAAIGEEPTDETARRYAQLDQTWGRRETEPRPLVSVQDGRYRLFHHATRPERKELYDVVADPFEQENLAEELPEEVARLEALAVEYLDSPEASWGAPDEIELDDFELGQLRALGYAVGGREPEDELVTADELTPEPEAEEPAP